MDTADDPVALVSRLWAEHTSEPWDPRWNSLEVAGVDLASLETRLAGCTRTWVANAGSLHERGTATVRLVHRQLEAVLPQLTEEDSPHVWHRLQRIARVIVAHDLPIGAGPVERTVRREMTGTPAVEDL